MTTTTFIYADSLLRGDEILALVDAEGDDLVRWTSKVDVVTADQIHDVPGRDGFAAPLPTVVHLSNGVAFSVVGRYIGAEVVA